MEVGEGIGDAVAGAQRHAPKRRRKRKPPAVAGGRLRGRGETIRPPARRKAAGLRSSRPMNRAHEPRLRGGSPLAGAFDGPAGLPPHPLTRRGG